LKFLLEHIIRVDTFYLSIGKNCLLNLLEIPATLSYWWYLFY